MEGLESQNIEGLEAHRMEVTEKVLDEYGYRAMFDEAFPEIPEEERYEPKYVSFAISAYLRTLLTTEAPFQKWLRGEDEAMTNTQKKGAIVFFDKAKCFRCHKSPSLNSVEFTPWHTRSVPP